MRYAKATCSCDMRLVGRLDTAREVALRPKPGCKDEEREEEDSETEVEDAAG